MPPIPCSHCGGNFMRTTTDPESPKLCNNCLVREEKRNPRKEEVMDTVDILIRCPREDQIEIEELCINQGIDFSRYFLELHYGSQAVIETLKEHKEKGGQWEDKIENLPQTSTTGIPSKFAVKKKVLKK